MPTPPHKRFDNRLNKLHREHRRSWADYSTICPKARARHAISKIDDILERDIATHAGIFRAQNELSDVLAYVAFSLENLTVADRARDDIPTKYGLRRFLASDVTKLVYVWMILPRADKEAIRRAVEKCIKPVFRRAREMLRPIASASATPLSNSPPSNRSQTFNPSLTTRN